MIPNKTRVESTLSGLETNKFSIQITDKSFRILLDGLYTDKHQSIIRELWTNALDSHKSAGREDVPFDCKLPNSLDPTFYVRDYGTGLSHEDIMHLYSTVFASTKTDTNEQIGCLGLGSKSPFSYTDSFTVISYDGNEKRTYIAALDEDGIPAITHFNTESSNEHCGLQVMFSSASGDHSYFSKAACRVSIGFSVKPNITGTEISDMPKPAFESETLEIYGRSEHITSHMIKMGPVLYPIPESETRSLTSMFGWSSYAVITVPVGSVEFAANREALQLTDDTRKVISNVISENIKKLNETIQIDLKDADSYLDACKRYSYWSGLLNHRIENFRWKGAGPLVSATVLLNKKLVEDLKIQHFDKRLEYLNSKHDFGIPIYSINKLKFVINNGEKMPRRMVRVREFCKQNSSDRIYFLNNPSEKSVKRLKRSLGLADHNFMSITDLPDVEVTKSGSSDPDSIRGVTSVKVVHGSPSFTKITSVSSLPEDYLWCALPSAKSNVDINLTKLHTVAQFNDNYYGSLKDVLNSAQWLGWEGKFLFFGPQAIKKFEDDLDDSMNLENYIIAKIEEQRDSISVQIGSSEGTNLNVIDPSVYDLLNIPKPSSINVPNTIRRYFKISDIELEVKDYSDLQEKYPMLFRNKVSEDTMKQYIDLVNSK
jgi:hypothetical protein